MATVTPAVRLLLNCLLLATTAYAARTLPGGLASRRLLQSTETCPDSANLLSLVNAARAAHGAPALTWSDTIAAAAAAVASTCSGNHGGSGYGQNILAAWGPITDGGCSMAMQYWYNNEAGSYDYANPGFQANSGHFSQIVWLSTTQMGCAVAQCPGSSWYAGPTAGNWHFIVCDFDPSGNVDGEFAANVLPEITVSPVGDVQSPWAHGLVVWFQGPAGIVVHGSPPPAICSMPDPSWV
ncbi:hypothetical protein ACKKBG_A00160 [Auxenochlorella protothecoides x Auxenochlorella symbiontica]